jgi:phospholipid/cholesterol/gamma-HCH transport system substrate-binding protein
MITPRTVLFALGAAAAAVIVAVALGGGGNPYRIRVLLADAGGLRQGSRVTVGGVPAGTVSLHLGDHDRVIADLSVDSSQAPVGKDASVAIAAVNFLGQKQVALSRGNPAEPAPSGYVLPASHVTTSTDLDQVLGVLDASTRARLAILINEAGTALTGRRADLSQILGQLPPSLTDATALLGRLVSDNHTLAHVVATSGQFVSAIAPQRQSLSRTIDVVGQTAVTVAGRRAQLRETLAQAPGTLRTLQSFLHELQATTVPLGPAARDISTTAPYLSSALAQLDPFRRAADPTLRRAITVAPELTRLALGATPVLRRANPVASSLSTLSTALTPVTGTLNHSVDNILAIVENWSRAIQLRDGLSHVFRGEASITTDTLVSLVDRLGNHSKGTTVTRTVDRSSPSSMSSLLKYLLGR